MTKGNDYDFYGYGQRIADDLFIEYQGLAKAVEEKYGIDARLAFECGYTVNSVKYHAETIEDTLPKNVVSINGRIDRDEKYRNNSYFGEEGISLKETETGEYNDPYASNGVKSK